MLTWVLYKKEVKSLFGSWVAYVTLIAFNMLAGITFYIQVQVFEMLTRYSESVQEGMARQSWNLLENLIQPVYNMIFMLLFVMVPALTMRLFAEEKRQRTAELLLTSPVRVGEIVAAKYLAVITLITLMILPTGLFPAMAFYYGQPIPDWGPMVTGFAALFLLGYSLSALGVFASSLTENQIVAFVFAVALEMLFLIIAQATVTFDVVRIGDAMINLGGVLRALSITEHFEPLLSGILRLSDVFYFFTMIGFWLWASRQSIESTRWG